MTGERKQRRLRARFGGWGDALPALVPIGALLVVLVLVVVGWQRQNAAGRRLLDGFSPSPAWVSLATDGGTDALARRYQGPVPADPAALTARISSQARAAGLQGERDPSQDWRLTRSGPAGAEVRTWTADFADRSSLSQRELKVTLRVYPDHADLTAVLKSFWAGP